MISKVGTDIVEIDKIKQYSTKKYFLDKVFTKNEINYAIKKDSGKRKAEHLATTFAAKEAIFKALGTGWLNPQEIDITRKKNGEPQVTFSGKLKQKLKNKKIIISLSFSHSHAIAFAVVS